MGERTLTGSTSGNTRALRRAVFCDRDGTLNRAQLKGDVSCPPDSLDEFVLFDGVVESCAKLAAADWLLIVVTNQPDVGRGTQSQSVVEAMHERLREWLPLTDIEVCYHPWDEPYCADRKPNPGMLLRAAERHHIDLAQSWMVGDRDKDIVAGQRAGCRTIFLSDEFTEMTPPPDAIFPGFINAAEWILAP